MKYIKKVKFDQFINENNKNSKDVKLADKVVRGKIDSNGFVVNYPIDKVRNYRVIGLNPNLKLQEVLIVKGEEELGEIEEFDWSVTNSFRPMFTKNHIVYSMFGGDWAHIWIADF